MLDKLSNTNERLVEQLAKLANKCEALASNGGGATPRCGRGTTGEKDGVPLLNGKDAISPMRSRGVLLHPWLQVRKSMQQQNLRASKFQP